MLALYPPASPLLPVIMMTAFLSDSFASRYLCFIFPDLARMEFTVSYIHLKYACDCSALCLALCNLTVETSFMAFVICCVLSTLCLRLFMSLIEAIIVSPISCYYLNCSLNSVIALTSFSSISADISLSFLMLSGISGYLVLIKSNNSPSNLITSSTATSRRYFLVAA